MMKSNALLSAIFTLLFCSFISISDAQKVSTKEMTGKWLVSDFSYKYADQADKDYPYSRTDFEEMVKFKKTFNIAKANMTEVYGEKTINFTYAIEGNKLYYWIPVSQNNKKVLDDSVRKSTRTTTYNVSFENGKMVWTHANATYVLKLILDKQ